LVDTEVAIELLRLVDTEVAVELLSLVDTEVAVELPRLVDTELVEMPNVVVTLALVGTLVAVDVRILVLMLVSVLVPVDVVAVDGIKRLITGCNTCASTPRSQKHSRKTK